MAIVLAKQEVITGIVGLTMEEAEATVARVVAVGGETFAVKSNVLHKEYLEATRPNYWSGSSDL